MVDHGFLDEQGLLAVLRPSPARSRRGRRARRDRRVPQGLSGAAGADAAAGGLRRRAHAARSAARRAAPAVVGGRDRRDRRCRCARELAGDAGVPRSSDRAPHHRGGLSRHRPPRHQGPAPVHQSTGARHPAQRARRLRRSLRAARGRAVLPAAAHDAARRLADRRRRGNHLRARATRRCRRWSRCSAFRPRPRST